MSPATLLQIEATLRDTKIQSAIDRERGAQRLVTAFILTGLAFMLLPGTFLGVWNLISISESRSVTTLSPAWIQAHGHAQIFGWIGTFILGIGLYSLRKMQHSAPFPLSRAGCAGPYGRSACSCVGQPTFTHGIGVRCFPFRQCWSYRRSRCFSIASGESANQTVNPKHG